MRNPRFKNLLAEWLNSDDVPEIVDVQLVQMESQSTPLLELQLTCADGTVFTVMIVHGSPPGGDNHQDPERIVTKDSLTAESR